MKFSGYLHGARTALFSVHAHEAVLVEWEESPDGHVGMMLIIHKMSVHKIITSELKSRGNGSQFSRDSSARGSISQNPSHAWNVHRLSEKTSSSRLQRKLYPQWL
jgi:hypothetical protein